MKKFMLVLLGGLLALPIFASSFTFTYKGRTLTYDVISEEGKTVSIRVWSNDNSFTGEVEIPATVLNEDNMIQYSVTSIRDYAFSVCSSLTSITIPNSVTSIGDTAFYSCTGLISITISNSVSSIGDLAFYGCSGLTSVYYGADKPITANYNIFNDVIYGKATLYVSDEGASLVGNINPWNKFKNIQIYDFSGIEEITVDFDEETSYEVFNLNGVMVGDSVDNLAPGLYIVRQGNVTKKISVK